MTVLGIMTEEASCSPASLLLCHQMPRCDKGHLSPLIIGLSLLSFPSQLQLAISVQILFSTSTLHRADDRFLEWKVDTKQECKGITGRLREAGRLKEPSIARCDRMWSCLCWSWTSTVILNKLPPLPNSLNPAEVQSHACLSTGVYVCVFKMSDLSAWGGKEKELQWWHTPWNAVEYKLQAVSRVKGSP